MRSTTDITVMLQQIATESEILHLNSQALFAARAAGRSLDHVIATCQLSHSCHLLTSRIAALRNLVTEFDNGIAGTEIGSLAELALRAQTLAILLSLDELYRPIRDNTPAYQELFVGRFRAVEDVVSFLFDALARINRLWLPHRIRAREQDSAPYRSAIRHAQSAMFGLGKEPDLAHFLRAGGSRAYAPQVSKACIQLAEVLNITLPREPDPELLLDASILEREELVAWRTTTTSQYKRR